MSGTKIGGLTRRCDTLWTESSLSVDQDIVAQNITLNQPPDLGDQKCDYNTQY